MDPGYRPRDSRHQSGGLRGGCARVSGGARPVTTIAILSDPDLLDLLEGVDPGLVRDLAESIVDPVCFLAEFYEECPRLRRGRGDGRLAEPDTAFACTFLDLQLSRSLSARFEYDNELVMGKLDTLEFRGFAPMEVEPFLPLQDEISDFEFGGDSQGIWRHGLYRAWLNWETEHFQVILGRQRIPWGVGRLWNPIDRFNAIGPLAIESDQSGGVDAVNARLRFSGFTYLQGVYAAAEESDNQSYAARLHGVFRDVDYSLVAGVFEKALALGFDLDGNLGDAAARAEVVWTRLRSRDPADRLGCRLGAR